jgi:hypothetical protein
MRVRALKDLTLPGLWVQAGSVISIEDAGISRVLIDSGQAEEVRATARPIVRPHLAAGTLLLNRGGSDG